MSYKLIKRNTEKKYDSQSGATKLRILSSQSSAKKLDVQYRSSIDPSTLFPLKSRLNLMMKMLLKQLQGQAETESSNTKAVEETLLKIGNAEVSDGFKELLVVVYGHFHLAEFYLKSKLETSALLEVIQRLHKELQLESMAGALPSYEKKQANSFLEEVKKAMQAQTF